MATVYHTYKQPRSTKKWNDKDAGNLPASVMVGFDVTSVVDGTDPTKFNVTVSGASDGAGGWYSSLRLPNGILIEEVVETIKEVEVAASGLGYSYTLIVCRCAWAQDEFLQPTYEHIAIASLDADSDIVLAVVGKTNVPSPDVTVWPTTPGARNWPVDRIESLRGVKVKVPVPLSNTPCPTGADTPVDAAVPVPIGMSHHSIRDAAPSDYLTFSLWCIISGASVADSLSIRYSVYLYWDPKDGTGADVYGPVGVIAPTELVVPLAGYSANDAIKLVDEVDLSALYASIPVGTEIPDEAFLRVIATRHGAGVNDTYGSTIYMSAASLEIVQTKVGEAF